MSWNGPGDRDDKGKKKDPWGRNQPEEGPPNIDELLKQLQRKLKGLFGSVEKKPSFSTFTPRGSVHKTFGLSLIVLAVGVIYLLSGIYVVEPAEEAVILRLGHYVDTKGPGPHWMIPLLETKTILNVQGVKTTKHGGQMLTKDENIVSAEIAVQYRISNAKDYLFNLVQPEKSIEQVSDSALRSVVGQSSLNEVLTSGRSEIGLEIRKQIQQNLNNYQSGLEISDLAMQQTKAPEEVKAAFDDAIKAQQDEERLVNEAEAYARKIIPIAEGHAKRTFEEARAYKERVTLDALGKTRKFAEILPLYQQAPQVTRERLFIDTLQEIYARTPKVLIDVNAGNNLIYLPLDKLMASANAPQPVPSEEYDESALVANNKAAQAMNAVSRAGVNRRPSYEDVERMRSGG